jgi:hypothetical protein
VAGIDIGLTRGLEDDEFFISYSGMKVEYDPDGPAFDAETFDATSPALQSRLTKLSIGTDTGGYTTIFEYDSADTTTPWAARWSGVNPATDKALVITNLYIAGFLQAFGLTPLEPYTGAAITPSANADVPSSLALLSKTILCHVAESATCSTPAPSIAPCVSATGGDVPEGLAWPAGLNEVKEWAVLFGYMQSALGGTIPDCVYDADETSCGPFPSRVAATSM